MSKISVTQAYLETARSIHGGFDLLGNKNDLDEKISTDPTDPLRTTAFALGSITIIYSYLAVEAFVNYELYCLWSESRECHDACIPKLQGFYEEYGKVDDFIKLKTCKGLRDLPDRIKTVEKHNGITHLHEKNTKLWYRFLKLIKEYRDFLVRPFPERFHEITDRIFKTKLEDYQYCY